MTYQLLANSTQQMYETLKLHVFQISHLFYGIPNACLTYVVHVRKRTEPNTSYNVDCTCLRLRYPVGRLEPRSILLCVQ